MYIICGGVNNNCSREEMKNTSEQNNACNLLLLALGKQVCFSIANVTVMQLTTTTTWVSEHGQRWKYSL